MIVDFQRPEARDQRSKKELETCGPLSKKTVEPLPFRNGLTSCPPGRVGQGPERANDQVVIPVECLLVSPLVLPLGVSFSGLGSS